MAKHTPLNVATLFAATMAAVMESDDTSAALAAGVSILSNATLAECVDAFVTGETSERASRAGKLASATRARELFAADGVDVSDVDAMRDILWPTFWKKAGGKGAPVKGDTDESKAFYMRHFQAARRMAITISQIDAPEAAAVRVPREAMELAIAMVAFDSKVVNEALKRARAAAKKAKAKAQ